MYARIARESDAGDAEDLADLADLAVDIGTGSDALAVLHDGGLLEAVVPDNVKPRVINRSRYAPAPKEIFADLLENYDARSLLANSGRWRARQDSRRVSSFRSTVCSSWTLLGSGSH